MAADFENMGYEAVPKTVFSIKWHFSKNVFSPSQSSKAVKTLIAKRANEIPNGYFGNEALNGLMGERESKWHFSKKVVFALRGQ